MGNNRIGVSKRITTICNSKNIDEQGLYKKAKLLLEIYRDVCWHTVDSAEEVREDLFWERDYASQDIDSAILYLETFAPDEDKDKFTERINGLFEVKWMIDIVDAAMRKVRDFPLYGELFADMLSRCYLSRFYYSEGELFDEFNVERTTFYARKKEAIKVFGLALWGGPIEEYMRVISPDQLYQQISIEDIGINI